MLPNLVLDNEEFDDIMVEARNMIISLYPEWTDFNYHDPGITLIEMFSWLKESQQFFLDQISDDTREKYLKLLGIERRTKVPSHALIKIVPSEDITVLVGTKLYAGEICFETENKKQLIRDDIIKCICGGKEIFQTVEEEQMNLGHNLHIFLFGIRPKAGNCFYMKFSHALPCKEEITIYFNLSCGYEVKRNPLNGEMPIPLAQIRMEYFCGGAWNEVEGFLDETNGAIRSGQIHFQLPNPMEEAEAFCERGYFLRLVLEWEDYDVPPMLEHISINNILLRQREQIIEQCDLKNFRLQNNEVFLKTDTLIALNGRNDIYLCEKNIYYRISKFTKIPDFETGISDFQFELPNHINHIDKVRIISCQIENVEQKLLGMGNGFPYQVYHLNNPKIEYESFEIMVKELEDYDGYIPWLKVKDFSASSPEDRHYILDSRNGVVRFGDSIHGMAPEGDIIITSYSNTLGRRGNVKAFKIDHFEGMSPEDICVYNRDNCYGGRDEETLEESFLRARKELKHSTVAVSDADYEHYVMETPGLLLENCKVISADDMEQITNYVNETEVNIVVKPFSLNGENGLSDRYKKNILAFLENYRMVGRKINLLSPQYITFEIYADIVIEPHYMEARETIQRTLENYFFKIHNEFGIVIQYSDLYGIIDILQCVVIVNSLNIDAKGIGVLRGGDGTIKLPPNGVVRLGKVQYSFSIGE